MTRTLPQSIPAIPAISPQAAARWIEEGASALALGPSLAFRQSHAKAAVWTNRARLDRLPQALLGKDRTIIFAEDDDAARLAAIDLRELGAAQVAAVAGGVTAWAAAGMPVEASPQTPPDSERIDYLFWAHDRHSGNHAAMRQYLDWETQLLAQIEKDGGAPYAIRPPSRPI
jgi:rhodanese-related sulfurtransferase